MQKRKYSVLGICLMLCILMSTMFLGYIQYFYQTLDLEIKGDYFEDMREGWVYQWDTGHKQGVINLPKNLKVPKGAHAVILSNILPKEEIKGAVLCIRASQQALEVKVNGKTIYNYDLMPDREFGETVGSAWHIVKLPNGYEGKSVEVKLHSEYKGYQGKVNKIYIGNKGSIILYLMEITTIPYSISIFIGVAGVIMLICGVIMKEVRGTKNNLLYLSSFIALTAIWSMCESKRLQFYISNQYLIYSLSYMALNLIPVPLLIFIKNKYKLQERKWYTVLGFFYLLNFLLIIILQVTNKADFIEMLGNTYVLLGVTIILIGYTIRRQIKQARITPIVAVGYITMVVACVVDIIRVYIWGRYDAAVFTRLGVMIFIILLGIDSLKYSIKMNTESAKAQALAELAYMDSMTGLGNRRSFQMHTEEINKKLSSEHFIGVIVFDVNDLKQINDTLGHRAGDEVIIKTSKILCQVFGEKGKNFRTGGDEFVVILEEITINQLKGYIEVFKKTLNTYNENTSRKVSIACGYDYYRSDLDKDVYEVFARADRRMYHNKYKQKEHHKYKHK